MTLDTELIMLETISGCRIGSGYKQGTRQNILKAERTDIFIGREEKLMIIFGIVSAMTNATN